MFVYALLAGTLCLKIEVKEKIFLKFSEKRKKAEEKEKETMEDKILFKRAAK